MKNKWLKGILGGVIGFIIGVLGGGYVGLVIGGNFLGGLDIYKHTGIEGYALTSYIGAFIGALVLTILGVKYVLKGKVKKN